MAGKTISGKILSAKSGQDAYAGDVVVCKVDCALAIDSEGGMSIGNMTTAEAVPTSPIPKIMMDILNAGGLVPYLLQYGDFEI